MTGGDGEAAASRGANTDPPTELLHFVDRFDRADYWRSHEDLEQLSFNGHSENVK